MAKTHVVMYHVICSDTCSYISTITLPSTKTITVGTLLSFLVNAVIFILNISKYSLPHKTGFSLFCFTPGSFTVMLTSAMVGLATVRLLAHEDIKTADQMHEISSRDVLHHPHALMYCKSFELVYALLNKRETERWNNGIKRLNSVVIVAPSCESCLWVTSSQFTF